MLDREIHALLVEDDPEDAELVTQILESVREPQIKLTWAPTYAQAIQALRDQPPDVAIVDLHLGARSGLDFTREVCGSNRYVPVILLTGSSNPDIESEAMRAGAIDFLPKEELSQVRLARMVRYAVARQQMARVESRFRTLVENSHELITILDPDGNIRYVSPSLSNILGLQRDEKQGASSLLEVHPDDRHIAESALRRLVEFPDQRVHIVYRVRHADGGWRVFDNVGANRCDDPAIAGIVVNSWDVTGQFEREQQLQFQSRLLETVGQAVIATDLEGRVTYWNRAAEQIYGWSSSEALGQPIVRLTPVDDNRERAEEILDMLRTGSPWTGEFTVTRKDGTQFLALVTNAPILDERGSVVGMTGASSDITHLKQTEEALRERVKELRTLYRASEVLNRHRLSLEERLRELLEFLPGGFLHPEITEARLIVGPTTIKTPGFDETPWMQSVPVAIRGEAFGRIDIALTRPFETHDGALFLPEEAELLLSIADVIATVVSRERMEEQLLQSQKLEAIGRLAGGIAHDFNNLLTVIRGQTDLVLMELSDKAALREEVEIIQGAADRAAVVTSQLLAFSRDQVLRPTVVDGCEIVLGMSKMLNRFLRENIVIKSECSQQPVPIEIDSVQLEQALMNLAVNAKDAMPTGGVLTFSVDMETSSSTEPGNAVLRVSDTGTGMDEAVKNKIFEPFFTTKAKGKGTGLGLAMVYGFMAQSGGDITVESTPGEGTTFILRFPLATQAVAPQIAPPTPTPTESWDGHGSVLLVEDSPPVRKVAKTVLERSGFTVHEAGDAETALELLQRGIQVHAVLTDLILPGKGGGHIIEWVTENRPELRVIVMSGYSEDSAADERLRSKDIPFLQKPFTPKQLLETVRSALAELNGQSET